MGSGNTMLNAWALLQQWDNPNHTYLVGVLVAYEDGIERVKKETFSRFEIVSPTPLPDGAKISHEKNIAFESEERDFAKVL